MTNLLKKDATKNKFEFNEDALNAFNNVKPAFLCSPMLRKQDPSKKGLLEPDVSRGGISGILSQINYGKKTPKAFQSRKMQPEETRYATTDQELLAVAESLAQFRVYLGDVQHKIKIYSIMLILDTLIQLSGQTEDKLATQKNWQLATSKSTTSLTPKTLLTRLLGGPTI